MNSGRAPSLDDKALELALRAHSGMKDKAGRPYMLHVLRVAGKMHTDEERLTALLHDVVEDSDCTLDQLRAAGMPEAVVAAVALLTKREGADYMAYVADVKPNPIARAVKRADLEDNMDLRRLPHVGPADHERLAKYRAAWQLLDE